MRVSWSVMASSCKATWRMTAWTGGGREWALATGLLLMLAALVAWEAQRLDPPSESTLSLNSATSEIWDLDMLQTDSQGQPHSRIQTTLLRRYKDGHAVLETPLLSLPGTETPWQAQAQQARVQHGKTEVRMEGEVLLTAQTSQPLHIRTAWLLVQPPRRQARTSAAVTIHHATTTHRADGGLNADLEQRKITLRGGIHSVFNNPTWPE